MLSLCLPPFFCIACSFGDWDLISGGAMVIGIVCFGRCCNSGILIFVEF